VCTTDGYEGEHCEIRKSSSDGVPLAAILGSVIPVVALLLLVLVCILVAFFLFIERRTRRTDDWELDINELDMGDQLGIGGHGVVHKAIWKGTEVAVKMMAASAVTRELERNFKEEVRT
jgi:preprotein translocase subunit YajC